MLHIGWHKTGTTTVQAFLHSFADRLAVEGVVYPTVAANHSTFLPTAFRTDGSRPSYFDHFTPPIPGYEAVDRNEAADRILDEILADVAHRADCSLVLSAEDLCLLRRPEIQRCRERLGTVFDRVDVIAYLRGHAAYARSATQQLIRMGYGIDDIIAAANGSATPATVLQPVPEYAPRLADWDAVFGSANVSAVGYEDLAESDRSVLTHFLVEVIGVRDAGLLAEAKRFGRINAAMSHRAAYVAHRMSRRTPLFVDDRPNPAFPFNRQRFLRGLSGEPFAPPRELLEPVETAWRADIDGLDDRVRLPAMPPDEHAFPHGGSAALEGDATLDELGDALDIASSEAILGTARQKLFAALVRLSRSPDSDVARRQLHLSCFLMADQEHLISSAGWLLSAGEIEISRRFIDKALCFTERPTQLAEIRRRLDEAAAADA